MNEPTGPGRDKSRRFLEFPGGGGAGPGPNEPKIEPIASPRGLVVTRSSYGPP